MRGAVESRVFRRRWHWAEALFWLAPFVVYFLLPRQLNLGTQILTTGLLALSLDLVVGFAGLLSLGQAAFYGMGAYTAGLLASHGWGEPITGMLAGAGAAAILGAVSGLLIVRVDGVAVLMITLGLNQLLYEAANRATNITGGDDGLQTMQVWPLLGRFQWDLAGHVAFLYALAVLFVGFLVARRMVRAPFGLTLAGIKQNPNRMAALGTATRGHLLRLYIVAAALAGAAGAVGAQAAQFVGLDTLNVERSADVLVMLILGGVGWLYGGMLGALVYLGARDRFADLNPQYWLFWLGVLLVIAVLLATTATAQNLLARLRAARWET